MILAIKVWMDKSYNCRKETKDSLFILERDINGYHYIKATKDSLMILEIDVWMDKSYKFNYRK